MIINSVLAAIEESGNKIIEVDRLPTPQESDIGKIYHLTRQEGSVDLTIGHSFPEFLCFDTTKTPSSQPSNTSSTSDFIMEPLLIGGDMMNAGSDYSDPLCITYKAIKRSTTDSANNYICVIISGYLPNGTTNFTNGTGKCIYAQGNGTVDGKACDIAATNEFLDFFLVEPNMTPIPHITEFGWQENGIFDSSAVAGIPITIVEDPEKLLSGKNLNNIDEYYIGVQDGFSKGDPLIVGEPLPEYLYYDRSITPQQGEPKFLLNGASDDYCIIAGPALDPDSGIYAILSGVTDPESADLKPVSAESHVLYVNCSSEALTTFNEQVINSFANVPITEIGWQGNGLVSTGSAAGSLITAIDDPENIFAKAGNPIVKFELVNEDLFNTIIEVAELPEAQNSDADKVYHLTGLRGDILAQDSPLPSKIYFDTFKIPVNLPLSSPAELEGVFIEELLLANTTGVAPVAPESEQSASTQLTPIDTGLRASIYKMTADTGSSSNPGFLTAIFAIYGAEGNFRGKILFIDGSIPDFPIPIIPYSTLMLSVIISPALVGEQVIFSSVTHNGWQDDSIIDFSSLGDLIVYKLNDPEALMSGQVKVDEYYTGSESGYTKGDPFLNGELLPEAIYYDTTITPSATLQNNGPSGSSEILLEATGVDIQYVIGKLRFFNDTEGWNLILLTSLCQNSNTDPLSTALLYAQGEGVVTDVSNSSITYDLSTVDGINALLRADFGGIIPSATKIGWQGDGILSTGIAAGIPITAINDPENLFAKIGEKKVDKFELVNQDIIDSIQKVIEVSELPELQESDIGQIYHVNRNATYPKTGDPIPSILYYDPTTKFTATTNVDKVLLTNQTQTLMLAKADYITEAGQTGVLIALIEGTGSTAKYTLLYANGTGCTVEEFNAELANRGNMQSISEFGWQGDGSLTLPVIEDNIIDYADPSQQIFMLEKAEDAYYEGVEGFVPDPNSELEVGGKVPEALCCDTSIIPSTEGEPQLLMQAAPEDTSKNSTYTVGKILLSKANPTPCSLVLILTIAFTQDGDINSDLLYASGEGIYTTSDNKTYDLSTADGLIKGWISIVTDSEAGGSPEIALITPMPHTIGWQTDGSLTGFGEGFIIKEINDPEKILSAGIFGQRFELVNQNLFDSKLNNATEDIEELNASKQKIEQEKTEAINTIKGITDGTIIDLTIPDDTAKIRNGAFQGCDQLSDITIPTSIAAVGDQAFNGCDALSNVYYKGTEAQWNTISIGTSNEPLTTATTYYYSNTEPALTADKLSYDDNYWRIVDEQKLIWGQDPSVGLQYTLNSDDESYSVSGDENCQDKIIVVAQQYENKPVISIGERAFDSNATVINIKIPDTITNIGNYAFYNCDSLVHVSLPDTITTLGTYVFSSCNALTDITLPSNLTTISNNLFSSCSNLTTIIIPNSVTSIGDSAFNSCSKLTSVIIPDSVKSISERAFLSCNNLANVTIGNNVTSIGSMAFEGCRNLRNIAFPDSLTNIETQAFRSCGFTEIVLPNNLQSIPSYAFDSCSSLTTVTIPNSITSIGDGAFDVCRALQNIKIFDIANWCKISGLSYIMVNSYGLRSRKLYLNDGEITQLNIPASVTSIGNDTFGYCNNFTSITIPSSVTSIEERAFIGCSSKLESIAVDSNNTKYNSLGNCLVDTEGKKLMLGCKNTIIPSDGSVISIGSYAFEGCNGLINITIPDSVTSIESNAFRNCTGLTNVTIGNGVTSISSLVFYNCSSLTDIIIPEAVTSIGHSAFEKCTKLRTIFIPKTVTTMEASSYSLSQFDGCSSALQIYTDVASESEKPSGWGSYWNNYSSSGKLTVHYGVSREQYECGLSEIGHQFGETQTTEPTCTEVGQTFKVCEKCGYKDMTNTISALGHIRGDDGLCVRCGIEIPPYIITNDTTYPWTESNDVLSSTNKAHNSISSYKITANKNITITFEYSVSSENNYDWLRILKGTTELVKKSGAVAYTAQSVTLVAGETLTFRYSKDGSASSGNDCAYIRNLVIT